MSPEFSTPRNNLDEPEIQELLNRYGDTPVAYAGDTKTEIGTLREALEDARCPLKDMLTRMPFEAQEQLVKQFIKTGS